MGAHAESVSSDFSAEFATAVGRKFSILQNPLPARNWRAKSSFAKCLRTAAWSESQAFVAAFI
mgnify:CR=1 FL=1